MPINKVKASLGTVISDEEFDAMFPEPLRVHSNRHYTSVFIAQRATAFLTENNRKRILDIGAGTGKFCLVGALHSTAHFTGVEYRKELSDAAQDCAKRYNIENVSFICANILDLDFSEYDAFYMFNPFLEHRDDTAKIDDAVSFYATAYEQFKEHVFQQLDKKKIGTRLVTYWTPLEQIPTSYSLKNSLFGDTLRCWEKIV